jgi:transposase
LAESRFVRLYLPTYSPQLNIAETVWRKLKYEWLSAEDYESKGHLQYAVRQALSAFGKSLKIKFRFSKRLI